jgi:hypothetical protein
MWIFTDTGFISAVRKPERPDSLTVRARDRKSLEALATLAGAEIKRSPHGDYPYRVFVADSLFNQWLLERTAELDYSNFKNQVAKTRGSKFVHLLHDVWAAMLGAEDDESRTPVLDANGNELAHSDGQPLPIGKTRVTNFGETVEDIAEDDPRIVAYYWEGYEVGTENPTWGYIEATDKDDMRFGLLGQVEEITFYGLRTMPAGLLKEVE